MGSDAFQNIDTQVVRDFGYEWQAFDQSKLNKNEQESLFNAYFSIFPWEKLPHEAIGFDAGCGSGRWAALVAPRVKHLHCIDPSSAIVVARNNLQQLSNCSFHQASVSNLPFADSSMDFGYSLGVLHHIPDTQQGISDCVQKLKPGAPFLVYLYYAFDNQPKWFYYLWRLTDIGRRVISKLPHRGKYICSQLIAAMIYLPLARLAWVLSKIGLNVVSFPLGNYKDKSFYTMRTDALDRFGTRLEKRFSRDEIVSMLNKSGLTDIKISDIQPYWCAIGFKKGI